MCCGASPTQKPTRATEGSLLHESVGNEKDEISIQVNYAPAPLSPRKADIGGRAGLALAVFASWSWRFGLMGSTFSADSALATVMALRPYAGTSLYMWGGTRQGMLVSLVTRALHLALGLSAHATAQVLVYFISALGLFLAMGLLTSWPLRIGLALFFAWPSGAMAESLCNPMFYLPTAFLLAIGEVYAVRAAAREPTPARIAAAPPWRSPPPPGDLPAWPRSSCSLRQCLRPWRASPTCVRIFRRNSRRPRIRSSTEVRRRRRTSPRRPAIRGSRARCLAPCGSSAW